ncbi:MAG: polyphosphate polymerase domain-containing protein [Lachnospiraceae bacterium]|nr:polyphosphate polymerase domain-containing protein [Lachnospiraceae bacterium]
MSENFQRVEKKYLMSRETYRDFLKETEKYIQLDEFGLHTICNIYFDTDHYDLIRNSIEKPVYKEKLRLRSYGIPGENDKVYLELKKKWKGIVYKRRISLTLKEAEDYLERGVIPAHKDQIFNEIDYFVHFYHPEPKLYLAYDRRAYYGLEDHNLRITFDENIRSREEDLELEDGDYGEKLLEEDMILMELKVPGAVPIWLSEIMSRLQIYPTSFSKYGNIYKKKIALGGNERCSQVS